MLGWDRCGFHKKRSGTHYTKLVFLHPLRSVAHVVYSSAFGTQNVNALFFIIGWPIVVSVKSTSRHVMPNLCFCVRWDQRVT
jgi:hypothetical protein